jgi:hypothetical protein
MSIAEDRARLCDRDPLALLIQSFLDDETKTELEVICPEPGTVLENGATFLASENVDPVHLHSRLYTVALRGHWLKTEIWIRKCGRSVWLYKSEESMRAAKEGSRGRQSGNHRR